MRVNRALLFAGVFLAALGGVLVAADLRSVDTPTLTDVLRLWPLAIVAIGLGLVLRRSRLRLPTLIAAAALPGVVLGSALAVAPRFVADCGVRGEPVSVASTAGSFDGPATVAIRTGCGSLDVTTAPGNGWTLDARNTAGRAPVVSRSARSLSIESSARDGAHLFDAGRDAWHLALPTSEIERLSLIAFAADARLDLPDARIDRLALTVNASRVHVDATTAAISELSGVVNVGALAIRLPATSDLVGTVRVGGGSVRICAPPGLGLRIRVTGTAEQLDVHGVRQTRSIWENPDYASAMHRAELTITAHFGAIEIDPIGGCS